MAITPGTRFGPYEIVSSLGAGGMGEVYRARDTALDRDVALKVLPPLFATDPDRLMRFEREAKTLASLNHPNIAAIFGIHPIPTALVMELVEGEDLSLRIARGALPIAEALPIARQIAEALEAAHEAGIIHRDLKPANIKVREDGTVKVLDFGLAKALDRDGGRTFRSGGSTGSEDPASDTLNSPTMTSPAMPFGYGSGHPEHSRGVTQLGMILGTAAYMSPEQARGKAVDRRADVWAFGVVLYEMLTGRRLFGREEVSDTLAAVLTSEPDLARLPRGTPTQVRQLLARCLTKEKKQRLDSMAAARLDIEEAQRSPGAAASSAVTGRVWTIAAALIVAAFGIGWFASTFVSSTASAGTTASSIVAEIPAPPDVVSAFHDGFALSPDGETLAFVARNASGVQQLWTRRFDGGTARPIPGTEGASYPFWAPTGAHVAFFSRTHLRRVPAGGGEPQTICPVFGRFPLGSWSGDEILFATSLRREETRIFAVPASGGTPTPIESLGVAYRPTWLADGHRFIYASGSGDTWGVYLADRDGGTPTFITRLPNGAWPFAYAASGYLLMNRNDVLTAQRLDGDAGLLTGPIVTVSGRAGTPKGWLTVSSSADRLVGIVSQVGDRYGQPGSPLSRLQWVTRQGLPAGTMAETGRYWTMALSPDGRRVAANKDLDIWLFDAANRKTRVTVGTGPVWSADSASLAFQGTPGVWRQAVDRDGPAETLPGVAGLPTDLSSDNRWMLVGLDTGAASQRDILLYDMQSHTVRAWLETEFNEEQGRFSPDDRWIAYASDSTGRAEVYVRSFDGAGKAMQVSLAGGLHPRWRKNGRELYFLGPGDEMMAVEVTPTAGTIQIGEPTRLFALPLNDITRSFFSPYDVDSDGQRFLLNLPDRPASLFFLQGLDALLKKSPDTGAK